MEILRSIGYDFKNNSIEKREKVYLTDKEVAMFLKLILSKGIKYAIIISTCNRTEIFYIHQEDKTQVIFDLFIHFKKVNERNVFLNSLITTDSNHLSTQRLLEIGLGLRAQVIGDLQIIHQIKNTYKISNELQMVNTFLHKLLHTLFATHKQVVNETHFHKGAASISYYCTSLIKDFSSILSKPRVLLIGLGAIGIDVFKNLQKKIPIESISIMNRSLEKALEFSKKWNCKVVDLKDLQQEVLKDDIIITCVSTSKPIIEEHFFKKNNSIKLLLDLSVPRSITKEIKNIPYISLFNLDEISQKINANHQIRKESISKVEEILDNEKKKFMKWVEKAQQLNKTNFSYGKEQMFFCE